MVLPVKQMRTNALQEYLTLRRQLTEERESLRSRLAEINEALGGVPLPSLSPLLGVAAQTPTQRARPGRAAAGSGQSLREHVIAILQEGPKTKEEVLAAVQKRGYRFSTANPMNSLGVILYGKSPKFSRVDGRFHYLSGLVPHRASKRVSGGRRHTSAEARARIAAAQRARWARQRRMRQ